MIFYIRDNCPGAVHQKDLALEDYFGTYVKIPLIIMRIILIRLRGPIEFNAEFTR